MRERSSGMIAVSVALVAALGGASRTLAAQSTIRIPATDGGVVTADSYGAGAHGVVLVHGGRFDRASWRDQARTLADAGLRVMAIDLRAAVDARAGRETSCLYDAPCLARDVLAAVAYLRGAGATRVSLVGASLGGGAVAQAAADAPAGVIDDVVLLAHMPIDTPEKMQGRKLFIVARHDTGSGNVPRLPGIESQHARATGAKTLLVVDGSAHAQFLFRTEERARVMQAIVDFLTKGR